MLNRLLVVIDDHASSDVAIVDTIVIASDGRGPIGRRIGGSLIPGLITRAPMPVVICSAQRDETPARKRAPAPTANPVRAARRRRGVAVAGLPA